LSLVNPKYKYKSSSQHNREMSLTFSNKSITKLRGSLIEPCESKIYSSSQCDHYTMKVVFRTVNSNKGFVLKVWKVVKLILNHIQLWLCSGICR